MTNETPERQVVTVRLVGADATREFERTYTLLGKEYVSEDERLYVGVEPGDDVGFVVETESQRTRFEVPVAVLDAPLFYGVEVSVHTDGLQVTEIHRDPSPAVNHSCYPATATGTEE